MSDAPSRTSNPTCTCGHTIAEHSGISGCLAAVADENDSAFSDCPCREFEEADEYATEAEIRTPPRPSEVTCGVCGRTQAAIELDGDAGHCYRATRVNGKNPGHTYEQCPNEATSSLPVGSGMDPLRWTRMSTAERLDFYAAEHARLIELLTSAPRTQEATPEGLWTDDHSVAQRWLAENSGRGAAMGPLVEKLYDLITDVRCNERETLLRERMIAIAAGKDSANASHESGCIESLQYKRGHLAGFEQGREEERKSQTRRQQSWLQVIAHLDHLSAEVAEAMHEQDRQKMFDRCCAVVDEIDNYMQKLGFGPEDSRLRNLR